MNRKLWDKFVNNKLAVNCKTEEEAIKFLTYCDSQGIKWNSGRTLLNLTIWNEFKEKTCYSSNLDSMSYCETDWYEKKEYEIVAYEEIIQNYYYGDEILKMIRESQLKEGRKLIGYLGGNKSEFIICKEENGTYNINEIGAEDDVDSRDLLNMTFEIKEKEYLTFDEARNSGKKFKYKTWNTYRNIQEACRKLPGCEHVNEMLDEKSWEVEE